MQYQPDAGIANTVAVEPLVNVTDAYVKPVVIPESVRLVNAVAVSSYTVLFASVSVIVAPLSVSVVVTSPASVCLSVAVISPLLDVDAGGIGIGGKICVIGIVLRL